MIEEEPVDLLNRIVQKIAEKSGEKTEDILKIINKISKEKNILLEVASLLECKEYDIDFDEFLIDFEETVF